MAGRRAWDQPEPLAPGLPRDGPRICGCRSRAGLDAGTGHFTKGAGGYFAGMLRKFEKGELHLDRTLWRLREQTFGKRERSARVH
jgi:hypothetical protein